MQPSIDLPDTLTAASATEIDELAENSQELEQRISSLNEGYENLKKQEVELVEWRWVLKEAGGFFDRVGIVHDIATVLTLSGSWPYGRDSAFV